MGCALVQNGHTLKPGDELDKPSISTFLEGDGAGELDPNKFRLNPDMLERVFSRGNSNLFSFVIIADIQLADGSLGFGPYMTHVLDKTMGIETTVRGFYEDHADIFYLGFVLKAIRAGLERNTNFCGVIQLGDTMQFGLESELATFNSMIGRFLLTGDGADWSEAWSGTWLRTPIALPDGRKSWWCGAIGNHDVYLMGNFVHNFPVRIPGGGANGWEGFISMLQKTPPFQSCSRTRERNPLGTDTEVQGYYWFDQAMPDGRKCRMIVLNTSEATILDPLIPKLERGAMYPSVSGRQFDWLDNVLGSAQQDQSIAAALVFGHYPLMEITVNDTGSRSRRNNSFGSVHELLGAYSKVKAYYCGHLHSGAPPIEHWFGQHKLVEYICPSVQEFPKCFGIASLCKDPVSGEYTPSVNYYNLEDLMDLHSLPAVDVSEDVPPHDQQRRFEDWLTRLDRMSLTNERRIQLLAKYCYESSIYDIEHDVRTDISLCFNPQLSPELLEEYRSAQDCWLRLKTRPVWPDCRPLFGSQPVTLAWQPHSN